MAPEAALDRLLLEAESVRVLRNMSPSPCASSFSCVAVQDLTVAALAVINTSSCSTHHNHRDKHSTQHETGHRYVS